MDDADRVVIHDSSHCRSKSRAEVLDGYKRFPCERRAREIRENSARRSRATRRELLGHERRRELEALATAAGARRTPIHCGPSAGASKSSRAAVRTGSPPPGPRSFRGRRFFSRNSPRWTASRSCPPCACARPRVRRLLLPALPPPTTSSPPSRRARACLWRPGADRGIGARRGRRARHRAQLPFQDRKSVV